MLITSETLMLQLCELFLILPSYTSVKSLALYSVVPKVPWNNTSWTSSAPSASPHRIPAPNHLGGSLLNFLQLISISFLYLGAHNQMQCSRNCLTSNKLKWLSSSLGLVATILFLQPSTLLALITARWNSYLIYCPAGSSGAFQLTGTEAVSQCSACTGAEG